MRRLGKQRLPVLKNNTYCKWLYLLAVEPDNSSGLAKRDKKAPSIAWEQVQLLYKEGYIKPNNTKKNAYEVDWGKVISEFLAHAQQVAHHKSNITTEIATNKYLLKYFQYLFEELGNQKRGELYYSEIPSLEEIFNALINSGFLLDAVFSIPYNRLSWFASYIERLRAKKSLKDKKFAEFYNFATLLPLACKGYRINMAVAGTVTKLGKDLKLE